LGARNGLRGLLAGLFPTTTACWLTDGGTMLTEIAPCIYLVEGESQGRFPFSHSILIRDEVTALIDTGCGIERLERINEEYHPDLVLNSHTHPDHTAGNWVLEGTPLLVPWEGFDTSGQLVKLSNRFTEPGELAQKWRRYVQESMGFRDAQPSGAYGEGRRFRFGAVELVAVYTPGHDTDHYCFFEPRSKILFSFDIDLAPFGPWYGCRASDIDLFEASVRRVQALKPRVVVSSHLGIVGDGIESRFEAYLNVISSRDERILGFLSRERRLPEIVDQALIYGSFPYAPELLRYWEGNMIQKHLHRLVQKGQVRERNGAYVRA
jgi:glyoxylase-like metal-dependent hydrolase (beta-lactamase superfamily II)